MPEPLSVHLRCAIMSRDLDQLVLLNRAIPDPLTRDNLIWNLEHSTINTFVAERGTMLLGFVQFQTNMPDRKAYSRCTPWMEVLAISVDPVYRRRRIGAQLMARVMLKVTDHIPYLRVKVRERNVGTQVFLRQCGFRCVHRQEGLYEDQDSDDQAYVFLFNKLATDAAAAQQPSQSILAEG